MLRGLLSAVVLAAAFWAAPGSARAGDPPNQNDPCSRGGRNTCGTLGTGSYQTYRYGIRWFGAYTGVVLGVAQTYCIDLRYWYPSPRYRFRRDTSVTLENRDGRTISLDARRRMAYAVWSFGRTTDRAQAAAVMLYVHGLMGDGAPGEAAPDAIGPAVAARVARIAEASSRYHGPYRIEARLPARLEPGETVKGTIRVLSAAGHPVPDVGLRFRAGDAADVPDAATTGANGVAAITVTPRRSGALRLSISTRAIASTLPDVYRPTTAPASRNGQRVVAPASQVATEIVERRVETQPKVTTVVSSPRVEPGSTVSDTIEISGLGGATAVVQASLYGPFPRRDAIVCSGKPFWTGSVQVAGDGTYVTAPVRLETPGYYGYRESIAAAGFVRATETACGEVVETTVVPATPVVTTRISAQRTAPGSTITDAVVVSGLGALHVTVVAELFGPFPSRDAIRCTRKPVWRGTLAATGDGTYRTAPFRIESAGYYSYRESIAGTPDTAAVATGCGETAETTVAQARPRVTTTASAEVVVPGTSLRDRVRVSGLGRTEARIELELFGPFASRSAIRCTGAPARRVGFTVAGDGVHDSPPVRLEKAGFYAYREHLVGTALVAEARGVCGAVSETSLVRPLVVTGGRAASAGVRAGNGVGARTPVRVRIAKLGVDAVLTPSAIDVKAGVLGVPHDISRPGWWRDGAAPGDRHGAILLAGHVDSASRGAGAFFALRTARRGTRVELRTRGGRTLRYRVVSVEMMRKEALPTDVYSRRGRPRLVLVTCGGPFDSVTRHYRDNVVVTAVPV